jgi:hypothetical protein
MNFDEFKATIDVIKWLDSPIGQAWIIPSWARARILQGKCPAWVYDMIYRYEIKTKHFNIDNHCFWCGKELQMDKATLEHIVPESEGGETSFENTTIACAKCNNNRGTMGINEFLESEFLINKRKTVRLVTV